LFGELVGFVKGRRERGNSRPPPSRWACGPGRHPVLQRWLPKDHAILLAVVLCIAAAVFDLAARG
jgi:hypothetical protein